MKPSHPLYFLKESFTRPASDGRTAYIDLMKGVCIILLVMSHGSLEMLFDFRFVHGLLMPLFFFVAGLFFRTYDSYPTFFIKKFNNLILPLMFWLLLPGVIQMVRLGFSPLELLRYHNYDITLINNVLWFLICLFILNNLFYGFKRLSSGSKSGAGILLFLVAVSASLGVYLAVNKLKILPLWVDSACTALPFFYLGFLLKDSKFAKDDSVTDARISLFLGIVLMVIAFFISHISENTHIFQKANEIKGSAGFMTAYLNSFIMIFGLIFICKAVVWLPVVSYFGRYSLIVLCVHDIFLWVFYTLNPFIRGPRFTIAINCLLTLLACWIAISVCRRFVPWFVAQKPLIASSRKPKVVLSEQ